MSRIERVINEEEPDFDPIVEFELPRVTFDARSLRIRRMLWAIVKLALLCHSGLIPISDTSLGDVEEI